MNNYRTEHRERNKLKLWWHFKSVCLPSTVVSDSSPEDESKQMLLGEMSDRNRSMDWIYPWLLFLPLTLILAVCQCVSICPACKHTLQMSLMTVKAMPQQSPPPYPDYNVSVSWNTSECTTVSVPFFYCFNICPGRRYTTTQPWPI